MTQRTLDSLLALPRQIAGTRRMIERLRDATGVHGSSLSWMPRGSGPRDRIGETVPDIVDAEQVLRNLEKEYDQIRWAVMSWIDGIDDIRIQFILEMRYLENQPWDKIADECAGSGDPLSDDAVRKLATRYLKRHLEE